MYASKRTIGRQGVWNGAPADKKDRIGHGNRENGNGKKFYVQTITKKGAAKDANETMTKTVVHEAAGETFRLKKHRKRLHKCMKNQPKG